MDNNTTDMKALGDRLAGAIATNTDCLSVVLDELRSNQKHLAAIHVEESRSRRRLTVCAFAALPLAIATVLSILLTIAWLASGIYLVKPM